MPLSDVMMIAGDTSRSRCYLQALCARRLFPSALLILPSRQSRPGQIAAGSPGTKPVACDWGVFDPSVSVEETAAAQGLSFAAAPNGDINSPELREALSGHAAAVCVYSGFGGVLLRPEILACGKRFLHVHGGWLPDYKGSTTNHFSALEQGFCGASSLFLTADIDGGGILLRKKFAVPGDVRLLDHVYDALFRTEVLLDTLEYYAREGKWPAAGAENAKTDHYYIMHPVLRHVLALRGDSKKGDA